ncbi:19324_t:CDS:2 [Funneliformis geosporum]|uniref:19324_t:CDS:1 n=1 Tax=Funneliformis geosporum TaxID=1117311 RepID=A0A9W4SNH0_9GLOM|nr:19324_t:CDS:2 [Funneliformis geosporum]
MAVRDCQCQTQHPQVTAASGEGRAKGEGHLDSLISKGFGS